MSEFTQGPWVAKGGEVCSEDYEAEGQIMYDHICCCEVVNGESPNANLIAAAPELLDAIQWMQMALTSGTAMDIAIGQEKAAAAIAKALGK